MKLYHASEKGHADAVARGKRGGKISGVKLGKWASENEPWNKGLTYETSDSIKSYVEKQKTGTNHTIVCKNCNKEFTRYLTPYDKTLECKNKFCSQNCSNSYNMKEKRKREHNKYWTTMNCENCGIEFEVRYKELDRKKTCSKKCHYERLSSKFSGHNLKSGTYSGYKNHVVKNVEFLTERKNTCDLRISKYHNFGTDAGVIIHNSGKNALAGEDIRFARSVRTVQKLILDQLSKIAMIHLYVQGFKMSELLDFELELTNPSTIHEKQQLELVGEKLTITRDAMESNILSSDWVYKNI